MSLLKNWKEHQIYGCRENIQSLPVNIEWTSNNPSGIYRRLVITFVCFSCENVSPPQNTGKYWYLKKPKCLKRPMGYIAHLGGVFLGHLSYSCVLMCSIAMGWRRLSCVNIFFSKTTQPILTKFGMQHLQVRRQENVNFMSPGAGVLVLECGHLSYSNK